MTVLRYTYSLLGCGKRIGIAGGADGRVSIRSSNARLTIRDSLRRLPRTYLSDVALLYNKYDSEATRPTTMYLS